MCAPRGAGVSVTDWRGGSSDVARQTHGSSIFRKDTSTVMSGRRMLSEPLWMLSHAHLFAKWPSFILLSIFKSPPTTTETGYAALSWPRFMAVLMYDIMTLSCARRGI